ncbi:MAG: MFS transporter [Crocinitomicaceae bacterium]|nr:MFS transporter [Flavobacteriales bacterium]NQZ35076.1 MFS transporter [Crocinitomicaceae bacterium]
MTKENITTKPKHTKLSFIYAGSLAWQKLSYYGWRSILFLLLFDEVDKSSANDISSLVLWISIGLSVSYLIGGILGDLLIGNKNTSIIGGVIMFIGSMLFFFNPSLYPYLPITMFVIGCGLYQSNLKAIYAKLYLHDTRLLDSGFILLYLFINFGAFFGALLVGLIAECYGIEYGFLTVGISTALSITMLLLTKKPTHILDESSPPEKSFINKINLKHLGTVLALFAVYCFVWRLTYYDIYALYWNIDLGSYFINHYWVDILGFVFYIIVAIYLIILWSKKHYDQIYKLRISTIITLFAFGISYLFYKEGSITTSIVTTLALFAYTIAELLIEPLIDSSIAKLINRKFLAIAYGAVGLLTMGISYVFLFMEKGLQWLTEHTIYIGFGGLLLLSIILVMKKYRS